MGFMRGFRTRIGNVIDKIDERVDKPAKARGSYTQGSEQMIDNPMGKEMGRSTSNKRSGFGRGA